MLFKPRCRTGFGELGELVAVALGVHAAPETPMLENVQLAVARQFHQRLAFQHAAFILGQILEKVAVEEKETAVDPMTFEVGLLGELDDAVAFHFDFAEAGRRVDAEDGAKLLLRKVAAEFFCKIGIGQTVAIGDGELFGVAKIFARRLGGAAAGHVFFAGEGERDFPVEFALLFVDDDLIGLEVDGGVGVAQVEVAEIIFYHVGPEAEAEHEAPEAVPRIALHDVPEDGVFADGHHRFGAKLGFLLDAGAKATAQDEDGNIRCVHARNAGETFSAMKARTCRCLRLSPNLAARESQNHHRHPGL